MTRTPISEKWIENESYELIPEESDDFWHIRILKGDFSECIIRYGKITFQDDGIVNFDYNLIYSPIENLDEGNEDLRKDVSHILHSIIVNAISEAMEKETESGKS